MTGGRGDRRGPASRRDFGSSGPQRPRDGDRPAYDAFEAAELEDVSIGRTVRSASPRIGASSVIAVLAIALLLAGGFGLMGGRNSATPRPSNVAVGASPTPSPSPTPGPPTAPPVIFEVVPWTPCSAPSDAPPEIRLEVGSTATLGQLEILWMESGEPAPSVPAGATYPITIPAYVSPSIWIVGARCALSWTILLDGHEVDRYLNVQRDPRVASQNRFLVPSISRFGGLERTELVATLVFPTLTARVRWLLSVEPWPRPDVTLTSTRGSRSMVPGCDAESQLPLAPDQPDDCVAEIRAPLPKALVVSAGEEPLQIDVPGWVLDEGVHVECGRFTEDGFFEGDGSCDQEAMQKDATILFRAPEQTGVRTVRASFCARPGPASAPESMCFSWFAQLDVRPGQ